jgi:hypothetical protein
VHKRAVRLQWRVTCAAIPPCAANAATFLVDDGRLPRRHHAKVAEPSRHKGCKLASRHPIEVTSLTLKTGSQVTCDCTVTVSAVAVGLAGQRDHPWAWRPACPSRIALFTEGLPAAKRQGLRQTQGDKKCSLSAQCTN